MRKFANYGASTPEVSQREIDHKALARNAAAEGFVMLKNDDALPLADKNIALFGAGARFTVKGGSGSGDVRERHSVSIEEGLKNAGFTFDTKWLDRFEQKHKQDIAKWEQEVDNAIKPYKNNPIVTMKMFIEIGNHQRPNPTTIMVEDGDLDDTDTAIYVLSRQAGEGKDRRVEKGDYLLSDIETESLKKLSAHYKKLVLVLNCGSVIDLSILDSTRIDAVILCGQAGMEGGNALADVLAGKSCPCGKLTDTWAYRYEDYPSSDTFGYLNGNTDEEDYFEGIYVGYRYFSTFGVKPRFPFGYGLSYTDFSIGFESCQIDCSKVALTACVTNRGAREGKAIVELYLSKPCEKYDCEKRALAAFAKTTALTDGQSERVTLEFDLKDFAVFDESLGGFVLEKGKYTLFLGDDSESAVPCVVLALQNEFVVERTIAKLSKTDRFIDCVSPYADGEDAEGLPQMEISELSDNMKEPIKAHSQKVEDALNALSYKEKIMLVTGGGYKMNGYVNVMGAAGRTSTELLKKGIPNIIMSDGPAGINVMQKNACTKSGSPRYPFGLPEEWQWGWLKKIGWLVKGNPDKLIYAYRYATAFPSGTCIAQSWNSELAERVGNAVGREMKEFGISVWLAPGMNIHRNPLCGRNFEYYSEDPLVAGKMAAAITRGVQAAGGVGVSIKHFCCNNQEDNRMGVSSNVSTRALREIYLKNFRIAVTEGKPWTVMSSYNRVNGKYVCNSRELCTSVLRDEWGFSGLVMSDWTATDQCSHTEAINCGNDMIMPGTAKIAKQLCKVYKKGELNKTALDISCARVLSLIFASETSKEF